MKLDLNPSDLVDAIADGIIAGLEDAKLVPAAIGATSLATMTIADARIRWARDRARNIAQALTAFEVEEGPTP